MSDLTELQQRVEQAERRFGTLGSQHAKCSARLIELMDHVERQATERQQEIEGYVKEIAAVRRERDQVKTMLHDLLHAIEIGSDAVLNDTLRELDRRASAILGATPAPSASADTIVPFTGHFEDVSAADLAAEAVAEEQAAVTPDETEAAAEVAAEEQAVAPDETDTAAVSAEAEAAAGPEETVAVESAVSDAVASDTDYGPKLPAAIVADGASPVGESPVGEIIERISLLTRALVETRAPSAAQPAEAGKETVRRIA